MADVTEQLTGLIPVVVTAGVVKSISDSMLGGVNKPINQSNGKKKKTKRGNPLSQKYSPW